MSTGGNCSGRGGTRHGPEPSVAGGCWRACSCSAGAPTRGRRRRPRRPAPATVPAPGTRRRRGLLAADRRRADPAGGGMAAAWTGRQLVVWGGQAPGGNWQAAAAGAAYDPAADRWEVLPPAPIAARFGASAVWTGREVLFWGGQGGPDTTFGRRRRLRPGDPAVAGAAGGTDRGPDRATRPCGRARRWSCGAARPVLPDRQRDPRSGGGRLRPGHRPVAADRRRAAAVERRRRQRRHGRRRRAAADLARRSAGRLRRRRRRLERGAGRAARPPVPATRRLPSTHRRPLRPRRRRSSGEVFTWTGQVRASSRASAWRPSDAGVWRRTAPLDGPAGRRPSPPAGPDRIYAAAGQSARVLEYRIGEDRWEELPLPPIPTRSAAALVWTGSELLFWGGVGDEGPEMDGAIWHCC